MTSIEWLVKELYTEMNMSGDGRVLDEILEQAKEMHKQEIIDAYGEGFGWNYGNKKYNGKEYYQETFVSKGSDDTPMERKLLKSGFVDVVPKQKTLYTEEQMIGFAEWIINQDRKMVLVYTKKSLLNEYIQSLKQPKKD
jgi:hypothetical protein